RGMGTEPRLEPLILGLKLRNPSGLQPNSIRSLIEFTFDAVGHGHRRIVSCSVRTCPNRRRWEFWPPGVADRLLYLQDAASSALAAASGARVTLQNRPLAVLQSVALRYIILLTDLQGIPVLA